MNRGAVANMFVRTRRFLTGRVIDDNFGWFGRLINPGPRIDANARRRIAAAANVHRRQAQRIEASPVAQPDNRDRDQQQREPPQIAQPEPARARRWFSWGAQPDPSLVPALPPAQEQERPRGAQQPDAARRREARARRDLRPAILPPVPPLGGDGARPPPQQQRQRQQAREPPPVEPVPARHGAAAAVLRRRRPANRLAARLKKKCLQNCKILTDDLKFMIFVKISSKFQFFFIRNSKNFVLGYAPSPRR